MPPQNNTPTDQTTSDWAEILTDIEKIVENSNKKNMTIGIPTGFDYIDRLSHGLQPSELSVIASRPAMGKTALCGNIILHTILEKKLPVLIFTLEMTKSILMTRLLCTHAKVNTFLVRKGFISPKDWIKLVESAAEIDSSYLNIDDDPNLNIIDVGKKIENYISKLALENKRLALVVIDYIQLLVRPDNYQSRHEEMSEITRLLKVYAKKFNIPILVTSQLSRKPEEKGRDGIPQLSDNRDSGSIEQDADLVMLLYRPRYYQPNNPDKENLASVIIAKNRNGPTGEVELSFCREFTSFSQIQYENDTP